MDALCSFCGLVIISWTIFRFLAKTSFSLLPPASIAGETTNRGDLLAILLSVVNRFLWKSLREKVIDKLDYYIVKSHSKTLTAKITHCKDIATRTVNVDMGKKAGAGAKASAKGVFTAGDMMLGMDDLDEDLDDGGLLGGDDFSNSKSAGGAAKASAAASSKSGKRGKSPMRSLSPPSSPRGAGAVRKKKRANDEDEEDRPRKRVTKKKKKLVVFDEEDDLLDDD